MGVQQEHLSTALKMLTKINKLFPDSVIENWKPKLAFWIYNKNNKGSQTFDFLAESFSSNLCHVTWSRDRMFSSVFPDSLVAF